MCAVSAVTDYYRDKWFFPPGYIPLTHPLVPLMEPQQPYVLKPSVTITQEQWKEYQELKRRMEEYDTMTNQPDCIKPEVAQWEQIVKQNIGE